MKVSVIMAVYNGERFLAEAIESILRQTFTDFEFLIMNDGSTDRTQEILEKYRKKDNRIKVFVQENKGLAQSLNFLIKQTKGEYIARMDADDISLPKRLYLQVKYLDQHKEKGVVGTGKYEIAPNGLPFKSICIPDDHSLIINYLKKGINLIPHGSVMIRKNILLKLGEAPYRLRISQDFDLWIRLSKFTKFGMIPIPLYMMRRWAQTSSKKFLKYKEEIHKIILNTDDPDIEKKIRQLNDKLAKIEERFKFCSTVRKQETYEAYLNGKALFRNMYFKAALKKFFVAMKNREICLKAFVFSLLCFLGRFGLIIDSKLRNFTDDFNRFTCNNNL